MQSTLPISIQGSETRNRAQSTGEQFSPPAGPLATYDFRHDDGISPSGSLVSSFTPPSIQGFSPAQDGPKCCAECNGQLPSEASWYFAGDKVYCSRSCRAPALQAV